jgi:hypothetical protein
MTTSDTADDTTAAAAAHDMPVPLPQNALRRVAQLDHLAFTTTADLPALVELLG